MAGQTDPSEALSVKVRDSVELTKELAAAEQSPLPSPQPERHGSDSQHPPLGQHLSGLSPAEHVLVERSQDSLQVTKKRMARGRGERDTPSIDSDASCETSESLRVVCPATQQKKKKSKTRFFIGGHVSVPSNAVVERKSVGRRISEALGLRSPKKALASEEQGKESNGEDSHVTFQKFPEIID